MKFQWHYGQKWIKGSLFILSTFIRNPFTFQKQIHLVCNIRFFFKLALCLLSNKKFKKNRLSDTKKMTILVMLNYNFTGDYELCGDCSKLQSYHR